MSVNNNTSGPSVSNWNVPNVLTSGRIIAIPLFAWLVLRSGGQETSWLWWSTLCFSLLMLTDKLDGDIARARGLVTNFGKIADPIADKALMSTALICLNVVGLLPWWMTVVILIREIGITLWRMVELRRGNVVPASKGGKVKTALQAAAVLAFLIPLAGALGLIAWLLMYAALIVTVITGIQYILDSRKIAAGR